MPDTTQPAAETADAGGYASPFASIDLNRTPLAGALPNIDPPDPANPNLDGGQVLYHMALGARPQDFHPALQPLAQVYGIAMQPKPDLGPGLLGLLTDIRAAVNSAPEAAGDTGSDDIQVYPAAVSEHRPFSTTYPKTLDPTVERHVADYNQAHGLKLGDREYLDPDVIKAMIRQEAGHNYDALIRDPMQVNASPLDWSDDKFGLGLKKGVAPGADLSVKAGIQWLRRKAYARDSHGNEAGFRGWPQAVQRYNGRLPDYSDRVWDHLGEIKGSF